MGAFLPYHFGWLFLFPAMPTIWKWNNFRYHYIILCDCVLMHVYIGIANRFCTLGGVWEAVNTDNCTREVIISLSNTVRLCSYCMALQKNNYMQCMSSIYRRIYTIDNNLSCTSCSFYSSLFRQMSYFLEMHLRTMHLRTKLTTFLFLLRRLLV